MHKPLWSQIDLPVHSGDGWALWRNGKTITCADVSPVTELVENWLPQKPVLVGAPGATRFVPPICIDRFRDKAGRVVARNLRNTAILFAVAAVIFVALALVLNQVRIAFMAASLLLVAAVFAADSRGSTGSGNRIYDRALFFFWLYTDRSARTGLALWMSLAVVAGGSQLVLQNVMGGMDPVFHAYGVMYPSLRTGEWWRLLSGPFLHYSPGHFFTNYCLLMLGGTLAWALRGGWSIAVFVVGNLFGALAQFLWGSQLYDNMGGISAGVFALFGFILMSGAMQKRLLPEGLALSMAGIMLASGMVAEALTVSAASVAHIAGGISGLVLAIVYALHRSLTAKSINP